MKEILIKINAYKENKQNNYDDFIIFLNQDELDTIYYITEGLKNLKFVIKDYLNENKKFYSNFEIEEQMEEFLNSYDLIKAGYFFGLDKIIDNKYSTREKETKLKNSVLGLVYFIYESIGYSSLKRILINNVFDYSTIFNFHKIDLATFFNSESKNLRLVSELIHHETKKVIEIYQSDKNPNHFLFYLNHKLLGESKTNDFLTAINELTNNVFKNFIIDKFHYEYIENINEEIENTTYNDKRSKIKSLFDNIHFRTDFNNSSLVNVLIGNEIIYISKGNNQEDAINKALDFLYRKYFYDEIAQKYKLEPTLIDNCANWDLIINHTQSNLDILKNIANELLDGNINIQKINETWNLIDQNQQTLETIVNTNDVFENEYQLLLKFLWNNVFNFDISFNQVLERDSNFCEIFIKIQELLNLIKQKYQTHNIDYFFDDDLKVNLYINNEYIGSNEDEHPVVALYHLLKEFVNDDNKITDLNNENSMHDLSPESCEKWNEIVKYYQNNQIRLYCPNNNENYYVFEIDNKLDDQLIGENPIDAQEKLIAKIYSKIDFQKQQQEEININTKNVNQKNNSSSKDFYINTNLFKPSTRLKRITSECLKQIFSSIDEYENVQVKLLAKFNNKPLFYKIENERVLIYLNNDFLIGELRGHNIPRTMERLLNTIIASETISLRVDKNSNNNYGYGNYVTQSQFLFNYFKNSSLKFIIDNLDHQHVQFVVDNEVHYDLKFKNSDNVIIQAVNIIYNLLKEK